QSISIPLSKSMSSRDIRNLYQERYEGEKLVKIVGEPPSVKAIAGTHGVEIGGFAVHSSGKRVVICATIDNLLKGAATQCLQNMNLSLGYSEYEGSKSITQKINRKAILDVDVPRACGTVASAEAPLALRLQGNLLFGISRVYDQQCGYALNDAQSMREKMSTAYRQVNDCKRALDPDAGKARRDQLVLEDDPALVSNIVLPGLDADLDLRALIDGKPLSARHHISAVSGEKGWDGQPCHDEDQPVAGTAGDQREASIFGDDTHETFTSGTAQHDSEYRPSTTEISETTASAQERSKRSPTRKRTLRALESDSRPELRNSHLLQWSEEYVQLMASAKRAKLMQDLSNKAKCNAAYWMLGKGLGDVGQQLDATENKHPLQVYAGQALLQTLTIGTNWHQNERHNAGLEWHGATYDCPSQNAPAASRTLDGRMREEMEEIELGRNAPSSVLDDYSSQMPWNTSVSARGATASHAGSSVHSRRPLPSNRALSSASTNLRAGLPGRPLSRLASSSPLAGKGAYGEYGSQFEWVEGPAGYGLDSDASSFQPVSLEGLGYLTGDRCATPMRQQLDSFELCGPAAVVDTQTAGQSQWLRGVLDEEAMNFLNFIETRAEADDGMVSFTELLPPQHNTRIVATQALMHVLALATRGWLRVSQERSEYVADVGCTVGEIWMRTIVVGPTIQYDNLTLYHNLMRYCGLQASVAQEA
ncbi:hypothetical protein KEM52_000841, partial [Ascosphaera acerosa]